MYDYKQVIVLRKDLNMRKGKMIAQGAHASMKVVLENMDHPYIKEWLNGRFAKIAVSVDSEQELLDLLENAKLHTIPCSLIQDAGFTEFHGNLTNTCIAVGPAPIELVDKVTRHLKLL